MKRFLIVVACLVCAASVAGPANSAPLTLNYLIGYVEDATPSGDSDVIDYANNLINYYNGGADPDVAGHNYTLTNGSLVPDPPPNLQTVAGVGPGFNASFPIDPTGYSYLWVKFGEDGALYFVGNFIGDITSFDPGTGPFSAIGSGYSHATLLGTTTQVPEAGALLMLGSGLIGLVGYRRMRRMR